MSEIGLGELGVIPQRSASIPAPGALQIKLSAQQHRNFTACAKMCGLDLAAWIVQCADVQAAAAIDAMQASQRGERPSRKKQRPRLRVEPTTAGNSAARGPVAEDPAAESLPWGTTDKSATMRAARSFNARFRRRPNEIHGNKGTR